MRTRPHLARRALAGLLAAIVLALLGGCADTTSAQSGTWSAPLQETLNDWAHRSGAPAVVLSVQGPQGRWTRAAGTLSRGQGRAVTPDDQFRVASITKTFVAVVIVQLVAEGRLGLDDPLARYLPQFPRADRITLRHLLNHTSGVPDYGQVEGFARQRFTERDRTWSVTEVLNLAAQREPEFDPGASYAYSNTDYVLLGEVIRVATDSTWPVQVRRRILDPLNLTRTYVAGAEPGPRVVPGYFDADNDGAQENVETTATWPALDSTEGAAGAVVSTADDLVTFADALFHGRLLDAAMLAAMTEENSHHPRNSGYGLGLEIERRDYRTTTWGHGGFLPGFRSALRYLPESDVIVVALVNDSLADASDLAELAFRAVARSSAKR